MKRVMSRTLLAATTALGLVQAAPLLAQTAPQAVALQATADAAQPLADVVVTARRKDELQQNVPLVVERLNRTLEQALFTAQSRVHAVSEYIDTRRGSIGPEARTRLAEASRQLEAASDKQSTEVNEAISHANLAAKLAAQGQSLADDDVRSAQLAYSGRYGGGNHMGAMMGGIIIGDLLGGGMRGGFGGWSPTSFGSSGSFDGGLGGGSDGGLLGGGGRF